MADARTREAFQGLLDIVRTPQNASTLDLMLGVFARLLAQELREEAAHLRALGVNDPGPQWASGLLDERAREVMVRGAVAAMLKQ